MGEDEIKSIFAAVSGNRPVGFLAAVEAAGFVVTMAVEAETWSLAWQQPWAQWLQG